MSEIIPYVPNYTEAPSSPVLKDCYYNISLDKYYIYNGTQWVEAVPYEEGVESWQLSYLPDGETIYTNESYNDYNNLITALNREINATDVKITISRPECIYTISGGNAKADWSLLKIWINGTYVPVGRIAPKIVFNHSNVSETIITNNNRLKKVYYNDVLVYMSIGVGYVFEGILKNDEIYTEYFSNYEDLITFTQTTNLSFKKISIYEQEET